MGIVETVLCLQAGKCVFNLFPFLCLREIHNQAAIISLLILMVTDTVITGSLLCLWIGGWIMSPSTDVISLRFLGFQNEAYKAIPLLLPWVCFSEELSRSHMNHQGGPARAEATLSIQSRLLSLTCWLIAASYSQYPFLLLLDSPPVCETWDWKCPFKYIHENNKIDLLLLSIGFALGSNLFCSTIGSKCSIARTILEKRHPLNKLVMLSLLLVGTAVAFIFLPPFIAVNSWSIVALDRLCGLFRLQIPEPLITVHSAVKHSQIKDCMDNVYKQHECTDNKKSLI
ncbi:uncharacterized protein ACMZJ9_013097 [Mantella aurantiaca]